MMVNENKRAAMDATKIYKTVQVCTLTQSHNVSTMYLLTDDTWLSTRISSRRVT